MTDRVVAPWAEGCNGDDEPEEFVLRVYAYQIDASSHMAAEGIRGAQPRPDTPAIDASSHMAAEGIRGGGDR